MAKKRCLRLIVVVMVACFNLACDASAPLTQSTPTVIIQPDEVYLALRSGLVETNPHDVGIESNAEMPNVWGVLMEFWRPSALVTLVSLADGTTSLYFGNGGGVLGGGGHQEVADASKHLVALAEGYYGKMTRTDEFPLTAQGTIQFFILTYSGAYTVIVDEDNLIKGRSEFSPLFFAANDVISQLRLLSPSLQP